MKQSIGLVLAFVVALVSPARAAEQKLETAKLMFNAPDGWKIGSTSVGKEGVMSAASPDDEVLMLFAVSDAKNLDKAVKALDAMLGKVVTNAKTKKGGKMDVHGMAAVGFKGTAMVKDKPVKTMVLAVRTPSNQIFFMIAIVNATKKDAYQKTIDEVFASIKPIP